MMSNEVFDQFLHRRLNQIYIGYFVGLTLYTLIILATVHTSFNPLYGATGALILTIVAFYLLIVLVYSSINQMRPEEIIGAIYRSALKAREEQRGFLAATLRTPSLDASPRTEVRANGAGFVTTIDLRHLDRALRQVREPVEIVFCITLGSYVALHDPLATVVATEVGGSDRLTCAVQEAVHLEIAREPEHDPAYGVEQIATIGWTSISTAKSNPAPGLMAIRRLRDLWARWLDEAKDAPWAEQCLPIVYNDDIFQSVLDAFESLAVAASESLQHQSLAEIMQALAIMVDRLPVDQRKRVEDISLRLLSSLGEHVLTRQLDEALSALVQALTPCARPETVTAIKEAQQQLSASIGILNARGTRAERHT